MAHLLRGDNICNNVAQAVKTFIGWALSQKVVKRPKGELVFFFFFLTLYYFIQKKGLNGIN